MIKNIARAVVLMSVAGYVGGCTLVSAVAYQANGPTENKALYTPDAKEPMLVLVENYSGIGELGQDAMFLNAALTQEVKENKIAPLVSQEAVDRVKDARGDKYQLMGVSDIAAAVGAKQVLYVNVVRAGLDIPSGKSTISGMMEARVRIIDAKSGETRWPDSEDGESIRFTSPMIKRDSAEVDLQVRHDVAQKMAVNICNLFHNWKPQFENQERTEASGMGD